MANATGRNGQNARISDGTALTPPDGGQITKINGEPPSRLPAMALPPSPNGQLARQVASLPPNAIGAEMCLLGSILIEPGRIGELQALIDRDHFFRPSNGLIFQTMVDLYEEHGALDIVLLAARLADRGILDDVGGEEYLIELATCVPSAANAEHYARLVREKAGIGEALKLAVEVFATVDRDPSDLSSLLGDIRIRIENIEPFLSSSSAGTTLADDLRDPADVADDETIPTGLSWFDRTMAAGVLTRGEIVAFASLPKVGKSALCLRLVLSALEKDDDLHVVWARTEMTRPEMQIRSWAMLSGLTFGVLRRPDSELAPLQREAKQRGRDALITLGQRVHEVAAPFTPASIEHEVLAHDAALIVIDYIQKLRPNGRCESRREGIDDCMSEIVRIAKQRRATVFLISNVSKAAVDKFDMATIFKESSTIGYDVDVGFVGKLVGNDDLDDPAQMVEIRWRCLGNRNGPPRSFTTMFDRCTQSFFDVADDHETPAN